MKEILKKNQAITLVSLVVTIIVLIILAGVSINLILGENGIITKAKEAKTKTEQATLNEEIALNELYSQISETGDSSISYDNIEALIEFKRKIASAITDIGIETSASASADTMASNIRSLSTEIYEGALDNASSNSDSGSIIIKQNGIVFINRSFRGSFTTGSIITTLPEGYRPDKAYNFPIVGRTIDNSYSPQVVTINTDGTITLGETSSTWNYIPIHCCFPI